MLQQTLLGQASNSRVDVGDDIDATLNTEDQVAERINQVAPSSSGEAKDRVSRDFFFPGIRRYRADGKYRGGTDRVRSKRNARSDGRMTPVRIESTADSTVRPFFLSSFLLQPLVSPLFSRHFPPHDESFSGRAYFPISTFPSSSSSSSRYHPPPHWPSRKLRRGMVNDLGARNCFDVAVNHAVDSV